MKSKKLFVSLFFSAALLAPIFVLGDSGNITSLVFTTNPQSVAMSTLSAALTVQTINSTGAAEKVSETNDVTFTSTSNTGQFLNSSGSAVSTTMSTNTSSRTFYYEDPTAGTYTITVTIKGRTSGMTFSATQQITVTGNSNNSTQSQNSSGNSSTTTATTTNSSSDNDSDDQNYSYSSQASIYVGQNEQPFNISIGRNRLAAVGAPISFQAELIPDSDYYSGIIVHWSFGDGSDWTGISTNHTYIYPGDYVVVASAARGSEQAVAEAKIKVVPPTVSISNISPEFAEISNSGDYEMNLGGYMMIDGNDKFIIPQDTIVEAHSTIKIPSKVEKAGIFSGEIDLYNPSVTKLASANVSETNSSDIAIALPSGMTADEFAQKFSIEFKNEESRIGEKNSLAAAPAAGAAATSSFVQANASTSAAAVIYTVPQDSIISNVGSWLGNLFKR